jgi:hypothetical protein
MNDDQTRSISVPRWYCGAVRHTGGAALETWGCLCCWSGGYGRLGVTRLQDMGLFVLVCTKKRRRVGSIRKEALCFYLYVFDRHVPWKRAKAWCHCVMLRCRHSQTNAPLIRRFAALPYLSSFSPCLMPRLVLFWCSGNKCEKTRCLLGHLLCALGYHG